MPANAPIPAGSMPVNAEKKLSELVAGDVVIVISGYGRSRNLAKIEKVTSTQIVVSGSRYRRETGRRVGEYSYSSPSIRALRNGEIETVREDNRKSRLCSVFRDFKWSERTLAELEAVWVIIKPKEESK